MKKIVYNALYCMDNYIKTPNTKIKGGKENYIKQSYVSLKSAKINNPDIDAVLVTNNSLPQKYRRLFEDSDIKVDIVPFDDFCMPDNWRWTYAFYKLKALQYMSNLYEDACLLGLDTDTYVASSLECFWDECCSNRPILLPMPFDSMESGRKMISDDYMKLYELNKRVYIVQWGGEFLGGSAIALRELSAEIHKIYNRVREINFDISSNHGDEAFLSMAAYELSCIPAVPYVRRYWSRRKWYEVDSAWFYVPVWHLPSEKNYGFNVIFNQFKRGKVPPVRTVAKVFNLPFQHKYNSSMVLYYVYNLLHR